MDEITSGDSSQVLAWLEARGVGDFAARYAMDEATRCDLGTGCPDGCGVLDGHTVTFDAGAGTWTARSSSGQPAPGTWTVFASSGEHTYAAPSAARALAAHDDKRPDDFVQAIVNDAFPAETIIAHLTGAGRRAARSGSTAGPGTWTVLSHAGERSYAAGDAALAAGMHQAEHPGDFVQAVINDEYPASVIIANLIANS